MDAALSQCVCGNLSGSNRKLTQKTNNFVYQTDRMGMEYLKPISEGEEQQLVCSFVTVVQGIAMQGFLTRVLNIYHGF